MNLFEGNMMIDGKKLAEAGFRYLGVPYSRMDCQAFAEQCLRDCGLEMNLAGSNDWYREVMKNGTVLAPEECMADNFAFAVVYGAKGLDYETPELIEAVIGALKEEYGVEGKG